MGRATRSAARDGRTIRIAVDVGGTFTDTVAIGPGGVVTSKIPSVPSDFSESVLDSIGRVLRTAGPAAAVREVVHGTTVATNAILEQTGARTGLITTLGFRDVLELRRLRMPRLYDMMWEKPTPLVRRALRLEVDERLDATGSIVRDLDPNDARETVRRLIDEGVESIAVSLLHSYANPVHERLIEEAIDHVAPSTCRSLSSQILPVIREYERTSTTIVNAYVQPLMGRYLTALRRGLAERQVNGPLWVMQSNGGVMGVDAAVARPVYAVESGPAAGVIATASLARHSGYGRVIAFDMGGTTAKAALLEDGRPTYTSEFEFAAGVSARSRLSSGGGYAISVPFIDLAEVGAGGGSVISLDRVRALKVGPQSAGADPGPVCYGRGGERPTVTDANVVLGFLDPISLLDGDMRLDRDRAIATFRRSVSEPLGLEMLPAAYGAHELANAMMIRAIKTVTVQRGRDPRDFSLVAFGGSGPVHAAGIARELGIERVVVPPSPGLFAACGLLGARIEHHAKRTFLRSCRELGRHDLEAVIADLKEEGRRTLDVSARRSMDLEFEVWAEMRYSGQAFELPVRIPLGRATATAPGRQLSDLFNDEHERTYGHRTSNPAEIVHVRVVTRDRESTAIPLHNGRGSARTGRRLVYFGPRLGAVETLITTRAELSESRQPGPLIVQEYDSTTVVPPGFSARLDANNNIILEASR